MTPQTQRSPLSCRQLGLLSLIKLKPPVDMHASAAAYWRHFVVICDW